MEAEVLNTLLIFLTLYLFWRINRYENQVYMMEKKCKHILKIYLASLPIEKRLEVIQEEQLEKEWGKMNG